jgi:asparagine synthase (glutamine-hydrolysing)
MCGIVGAVCSIGSHLSIGEREIVRMRDRLTHRGPDDAGLWLRPWGAIGHRRLSIRDLSDAGHQPMVSDCGGAVLAYNGELYNDAELRTDLAAFGTPFRSTGDTQTLLAALQRWGIAARDRLRGMYALAYVDEARRTLTLARDPLGIKPLYYWSGRVRGQREVVFASEPSAILLHPAVSKKPDTAGVDAYVSTIRTTLGERTLFEGVRCVRAGQWLVFDLHDLEADPTSIESCPLGSRADAKNTHAIIEDSVRQHLATDVPLCSLLSGGLDSTIIAAIASREGSGLHTYAAGFHDAARDDDDLSCAARVAAELGVTHAQVHLTSDTFTQVWAEMIARLGVPLSTPNEVAIHAVAQRLAGDGYKVALSGEGADELFAGYDQALVQASEFWAAHPRASVHELALHELEANAWVPLSLRSVILRGRAAASDALMETIEREWAWCEQAAARCGGPSEGLAIHLHYQQRVNLVGLLGRLDTAMMLASVEGRTPMADRLVSLHANGLALADRIAWRDDGVETKIALRRAFASTLPHEALTRAKASFPLPFQGWMRAWSPRVRTSALVREVFADAAVALVAEAPEAAWRLAWPMINLALWDAQHWGGTKSNARAEARAL